MENVYCRSVTNVPRLGSIDQEEPEIQQKRAVGIHSSLLDLPHRSGGHARVFLIYGSKRGTDTELTHFSVLSSGRRFGHTHAIMTRSSTIGRCSVLGVGPELQGERRFKQDGLGNFVGIFYAFSGGS